MGAVDLVGNAGPWPKCAATRVFSVRLSLLGGSAAPKTQRLSSFIFPAAAMDEPLTGFTSVAHYVRLSAARVKRAARGEPVRSGAGVPWGGGGGGGGGR